MESVPVYYIEKTPNTATEERLREQGIVEIHHFEEINGRELDMAHLVDTKLIGIRGYEDLTNGREQHGGIPSMGSIGCTLSHYNLWSMCVEKNMPFIGIAENDVVFDKKLSAFGPEIKTFFDTNNAGLFVTVQVYPRNNGILFNGTQFYYISKAACASLMEFCFPIDLQVDWYMSEMHNLGKVTIGNHPITGQDGEESSIQNKCFKCNYPLSADPYERRIHELKVCLNISIVICLLLSYVYLATTRRQRVK